VERGVGQSTTGVFTEGPFLRTGLSGQVWNVTGKVKKDTYYGLIELGPVGERPELEAAEKKFWKWDDKRQEDQ